MKHKHYLLIEEWARTGKQVQRYGSNAQWYDCLNNNPAWDDSIIYRFKPEVLRYRISLHTDYGDRQGFFSRISTTEEEARQSSSYTHFSRWVTDWQEYEI